MKKWKRKNENEGMFVEISDSMSKINAKGAKIKVKRVCEE